MRAGHFVWHHSQLMGNERPKQIDPDTEYTITVLPSVPASTIRAQMAKENRRRRAQRKKRPVHTGSVKAKRSR